jgi:hypothetical protein
MGYRSGSLRNVDGWGQVNLTIRKRLSNPPMLRRLDSNMGNLIGSIVGPSYSAELGWSN